MPTSEVLKPFFQKRYVCAQHGYFDVRLPKRPADSFRPKCPVCSAISEPRGEEFECTGKTTGPIPHITKPRIEETVTFEFPSYSEKGFQQARRKGQTRRP